MKKTLWLDVETTGLDAANCALIQLSCLVEIDGKTVAAFDTNLAPHPGAVMTQEAFDVNGMTKEQVLAFKPPQAAYTEFLAFLDTHINKYDKTDKFILAGYNVKFDLDFISAFFTRNDNVYLGAYIFGSFFDVFHLVGTLRYRGDIPAAELPGTKLQDVATYFGLTGFDFHNSMDDIKATKILADVLLEELSTPRS